MIVDLSAYLGRWLAFCMLDRYRVYGALIINIHRHLSKGIAQPQHTTPLTFPPAGHVFILFIIFFFPPPIPISQSLISGGCLVMPEKVNVLLLCKKRKLQFKNR